MKNKTIIVTGSFRGGTSITTKILQEAGVYFGEIQSRKNNEDPDFQKVLFNAYLEKRDLNIADFAEIKRLAEDRNKRFETWGFKFPASFRWLPQVVSAFENPYIVAVTRDPLAVARSEATKKDGVKDESYIFGRSLDFYREIWNLYEQQDILLPKARMKVFSFEWILTRTIDEIIELLNFVEIRGNALELSRLIKLPENNYHYLETAK